MLTPADPHRDYPQECDHRPRGVKKHWMHVKFEFSHDVHACTEHQHFDTLSQASIPTTMVGIMRGHVHCIPVLQIRISDFFQHDRTDEAHTRIECQMCGRGK
jgi:hypothetical protein